LTQHDRGIDVEVEVGEHRCRGQSAAQPNSSTYAMIKAARPSNAQYIQRAIQIA
jgi:hypothetical protein